MRDKKKLNYNSLKTILTAFFALFSAVAFSQCTANAGIDTTICPGGNANLGALVAGTGSGAITYSWSPSTNLSCSNCPNPVATPSSTTTYTLTITDGAGCSASDNITVNIANLPDPTFGFLPNNVCASTPIQFSANDVTPGLTYSWNFGNPASGSSNTSNLQNPSHTFVAQGNSTQNFTVTLTVTNGFGCQTISTQTVTLNQLPDANLVDPLTSFKNCQGTSFDMEVFNGSTTSNSNYQIIWGDGSPDFNSPTFPPSIIHTYSTSDIFDLYFIVTGTNGCTDTMYQIVSNITNPAIGAANPGATTGCGPLTLCFPLSNYQSNHSSTIYVVDYGDSSPNDTLQHPVPVQICHTYTESSCGQAGNAFTFSIEAINLCDNSLATISPIRVYTGPTAEFNASPVPGCVNTPITFFNTSTLGFNSSCSSNTLFNWDFGDGTTLTQFALANPTHSYSTPGTYTVTLSAQNGCGTTTFEQQICIEAAPIPFFTVTPDSACVPFATTVVNTSDTLNSCDVNYQWTVIFNGSTCLPSSGTWSYINGTDQNSWQPEFQFSSPGTYFTRLTITNSCGSYFYQDTIIAQGPPQLSLPAVGTICAGESIAPSAIVNDCYELSDTYSWTFTGGIPASSSVLIPGTIQYDNPGNFNVNFEVTNACGSVNSFVPLTVVAPPVADAGPDISFCSGQSGVIGAASVPSVTYNWTPTTNLSSGSISQPNVSGTNGSASPITSQYVLTAATSPTCFTTDTVLVTVNPNPVLAVNNAIICVGESASLLVTGAGVGGTYAWAANPDLSCLNCDNPDATPVITTNYSVVGTNQYGCSASAIATVTVNPLPVVNAGADQQLCDQPISIQLNGSPAGGTWSGSPNVTSTGVFTPNGAEVASVVYSYTDPTSNCSNTDTVIITVNPPIIPVIDPTDSICANEGIVNLETTLNVSPLGGTFTGNGVSGSNFNPMTAGIGTHEIIYFYGSSTCQSSDTAYIEVLPVPVLATSDEVICVNDTIGLSVSGAGIGGVYSWSPSAFLSCSNCDNPNAFPTSTTAFTITGTDVNGCTSTVNATVTVNPLPIVNAGPDQVLCDQPIDVQFNGSPTGGTWTGSSNLSATGLFSPNGSENFDAVYTYVDPTTGCTNSDTATVIVSPPVVPTLNQGVEICFESPATDLNTLLAPNPSGGTWSGAGVAGSNFTPSIAGVGNHMLSYTYGVGTCQTITDVEIVVNPQPTINASDEVICVGQTASLLATGAGIGGNYTWSPATGLSCVNCPNPDASPIVTTNYTVVGTNQFGCSNSDFVTVTVNPVPTAQAGPDTLLCNLPVGVLFVGQQSGGTWSGPNIAANGLFTPSGTGTFTVTYTVVLGTGCQNSDDRVVTVIDPAQADAGADLEACINSGTVNLSGLPAGGTWSGAIVTSAGVVSTATSGTFSLVYSYGAGNCLTTDTMEFVVHDLPVVNAGLDDAMCLTSGNVTYAGSPIGGTWTGQGIINASTGEFDPIVATVGTHVLTYSYTDPITTCVNDDQLTVIVHPLPLVDFTVDPIVCLGVSVPFVNTSTLINNSQWDFGDGTTSLANNPTHTYSSIGFFDVQLIVTTANGCQDSITQTIEVREPPVANFTVVPDSLCGPFDAVFTNLSSGVNVSYNWDFGNGQTSTLQNPGPVTYIPSLTTDTSYLVTLDVTNYCGTVSHQETIIVTPEPVAIFGTDFNTGCSPFTVNIANSSVGLPDSYFWDFGDGTTSTTTSPLFDHVYTTGATSTDYQIMLIAYNECGSDTSYHTITVLPNTVDAFFNTSTVSGCEDLTIDFTQYTLGGTFYHWDFGDGNTSTSYSPSHTFTNPGNYDVALMANDGCSYDTTIVTITVFPSPIVSFTSTPDSVCINTPFSFQNTSTNLANSSWDFGDGTTSNLTNPSHEYGAPGSYVVTLTGTSLTNGCTAQISQTVQVSINPIAAFVAVPTSGCMPLNVQFTNQSVNATFSHWNFGDGNTSGLQNPSHVFTSSGVYTVQLIVENANGCTDTIAQNITVHPLPVADFTFTSTSTCYTPSDFVFTNQSTGAIDYSWDFGNGTTSTLTNPTTSYVAAGNYTISLTATNQYGCVDVFTQQVTIYPTPEAAFQLPTDIACANDLLEFVSASNFADSIVWMFGDGSTAVGSTVDHTYLSAGSYNITIMAYGAGGCGDTLTIATPIVINPDPIADFSYVNVQIPDPVSGTVEFTNLSFGANTYEWQFGNGVTSNEVDPVHRYHSYGEFEALLIATNSFGCVDSIYKMVEVTFFNGLFLPNAMYPGHADFEVSHFVPKGVGLKTFLVQIYDDWGNLIWESNALDINGRPTEAWDGTYKGKPVQQDAYVWKVVATFLDESIWEGKEYSDGIYREAGTVTVIR